MLTNLKSDQKPSDTRKDVVWNITSTNKTKERQEVDSYEEQRGFVVGTVHSRYVPIHKTQAVTT